MTKTYRVVGLMSGSSLDGLDIAYCSFQVEAGGRVAWELLATGHRAFSADWVARLQALPSQNALALALAHTHFSRYTGALVNDFLQENRCEPDFIAAHGHTIFHLPQEEFTLQIGDGGVLAATTGYPVVCNFRTQDVSLGGVGTPLAPLADMYLFQDYHFLVNLGGIANLTYQSPDELIAFDVVPCNQILNALANTLGLPFDEDGKLAAQGSPVPALLTALRALPYCHAPYPKSLDNEWIRTNILPFFFEMPDISVADRLRTAVDWVAEQVAGETEQLLARRSRLGESGLRMLLTGGGAFNVFLNRRIQASLTERQLEVTVVTPDSATVAYKEAILMGLMGVFRVENRQNCFASVTGALRNSIGGAIYQGYKRFI